MADRPVDEPRRLRVAVVVQRYGLEVSGGAELHARRFVDVVRRRHEVTVLTSRALDYTRWDRHYPAGATEVDGIAVLRFDHPPSTRAERARVPLAHLLRYRARALLDRLGSARVAPSTGDPVHDGERYLQRQGPYCAGLLAHLRDAAGRYDAAVFFTARFHPTAAGLRACAVPSVLVPTLHDERSMALPLFHEVFRRPRWILWNCGAEQRLAEKLYGSPLAPGGVCGVAVPVPPSPPAAAVVAEALRRHGVAAPYFVFVGRVTRSKGFHLLVRAFARLRRGGAPRCGLVVVGQSFMRELPQADGIVYAGFVDDAERDALIAGATAMVVTSRHESLSLVTLESMALGTPVIVNGASDVLRSHVEQSGAGWVFDRASPLAGALAAALRATPQRRDEIAAAGRRYVGEHYAAPRVEAAMLASIDRAVAG